MNGNQSIALVGSILLTVGVFLPILDIPMVGNASYFSEGKGLGLYVLILGILALGLSFANKPIIHMISGFASFGLIIYSLIMAVIGLDDANRHYDESLFSSMSGMDVTLSYGWIVMVAGSLMVVFGATKEIKAKY